MQNKKQGNVLIKLLLHHLKNADAHEIEIGNLA